MKGIQTVQKPCDMLIQYGSSIMLSSNNVFYEEFGFNLDMQVYYDD